MNFEITMNTISKIFVLFVLLTMGATRVEALPDGPLAVVGNVTYNYTDPEAVSAAVKASTASFYAETFEGDLVNGGASIGARGDELEEVKQMRKENNEMNHGAGGVFQDVDKDGKLLSEYYKKYTEELPKAPYRIDATINVWKLPDGSGRYDMNFNVRIVDVETGKVVGHTSTWKRNTEKYINEQKIGLKPTWVEKYISGYVREIKFEDPLETAMSEASKTIIGNLSKLSGQKITSDADRFLSNIGEITNPAEEKSGSIPPVAPLEEKPTSKPAPTVPASVITPPQSDDRPILTPPKDEPLPPPADQPVEPPPGGEVGQPTITPPTVAPETQPGSPDCRRAPDGTCLPDVIWTRSR